VPRRRVADIVDIAREGKVATDRSEIIDLKNRGFDCREWRRLTSITQGETHECECSETVLHGHSVVVM
jgi:hypothetical protein